MSTNRQTAVWYDGGCAVCRRSREWCEERDNEGRLRFFDFRVASDEQLPVPRHELESSMWVQAFDGTMSTGFEAWRQVVGSLPRWRWLARLTGLPPFRWLGPSAYLLVARLRTHLPEPRSAVGRVERPR